MELLVALVFMLGYGFMLALVLYFAFANIKQREQIAHLQQESLRQSIAEPFLQQDGPPSSQSRPARSQSPEARP